MNKLQVIALLLASSSAIRLQQKGIDGESNPELGLIAPKAAPAAPAVPAKPEAAPAKPEAAPAKPEAAPAKPEAAPAKPEAAPAKAAAAPAKDGKAPKKEAPKKDAPKEEAAKPEPVTPIKVDEKAKSGDAKSPEQRKSEKEGKPEPKAPEGPAPVCSGLNDARCVEPYNKEETGRYPYHGANPGDSQSLVQTKGIDGECNPELGECVGENATITMRVPAPKPWDGTASGDSQSLVQAEPAPVAKVAGFNGTANGDSSSLAQAEPAPVAKVAGFNGTANGDSSSLAQAEPAPVPTPPGTAPTPKPANPPAAASGFSGVANGDSQSLAQGIDGQCNPELGECTPTPAAPKAKAAKPAPAPTPTGTAPTPKPANPPTDSWNGTTNGDSQSLVQAEQAPVTSQVAGWNGTANGDSSSLAVKALAQVKVAAPAPVKADAVPEFAAVSGSADNLPICNGLNDGRCVEADFSKQKSNQNVSSNGDSQSLNQQKPSVPKGMSEVAQLMDQHLDTGDVVLG